MAPRFSLAASALAAAALLAPGSAHALTATSPVQAAVTIGSAAPGTDISFQGFSDAFKTTKGIPLWATLNSVQITTKGTTGGSVVVQQFNPAGSATVTSPGKMNLTINGIMPTSQNNSNTPSPATVPAAVYPIPGAGSATINVTPTVHTYNWAIVPGGTNPISFFYGNSLTLQALAEFAPTITGTPGAIETSDASTFALSSILADTFLTFDYTVGPEPSTVPSPLPIIGAASAFGFSRRLRSRIKQVS
jgi:hypothetical protein